MHVLIEIAGGIALLLWGIHMVRTGITRSFGGELRHALSLCASSRLLAFAAGLGVTAAIQSSTATALMMSSFAGRGLLVGSTALAILLGADVGTTVIVQVLSFDLSWLSPLLIAIGVFGFLSSESSRHRSLARTAIGLGLILLALKLIMLASATLRDADTMALILKPLTDELMLALLVGAAITWAAHSSVAIILLVISLASIQVLNMQLALALVLGANLGGAVIPVVATLKAPPAARRSLVGNLMMRVAGVLALIGLLRWLQPYLALADETPARMLANFHTGFNLLLAACFLPLVPLVDRVTRRLVPDTGRDEDPGRPMYLDPDALETPTVALASASREALRMGDEIRNMQAKSLEVFRANDDRLLASIEKSDDVVDSLHEAIKLYLTRLAREELDDRESRRCVEILMFTTNLEHVGDIIDKNLMELAAKKIKHGASFSAAGFAELDAFHGRVLANLDLALSVFMTGDLDLARRLLREKVAIRDLEREYTERHFARVQERRPESLESSSLHLDILRDLKRINSHLTSVAYPILERAGELTESRLVTDALGQADTPAARRDLGDWHPKSTD
ncbi:MAG TPA: Na/Pi cotransporter family protein [Alphaproteobacteria bacterium]|nr:Na/Pi cotransporter family protein [Alphaproteobacteria bacterium]